jgi:hypothetical protein
MTGRRTPGGGRLFPVDPPRSGRGRTRRGLDATIVALRVTKRWTDTDEALTALCRVLADQVDEAFAAPDESRFVRARVAAAYHAALMSLLQVAAPHDDDGDLDELLAGIFDPAQSEPAV